MEPIPNKLLLHACCGPCSMEPIRLLSERDITPVVYYSNSNIAPAEEYAHRLDTIKGWLGSQGIEIVEGTYDPDAWEASAGVIGTQDRPERCRQCYRQRFTESARYAAEHGFDALGTTLTISPYQYTDVIRQELERACEAFGLKSYFEDYSPYYNEATRRSREEGLYRQNYCGCRFSIAEAEAERAQREQERQAKRAERAKKDAAEAAEREERKRQRSAYDEKVRRKRELTKAYKAAQKG